RPSQSLGEKSANSLNKEHLRTLHAQALKDLQAKATAPSDCNRGLRAITGTKLVASFTSCGKVTAVHTVTRRGSETASPSSYVLGHGSFTAKDTDTDSRMSTTYSSFFPFIRPFLHPFRARSAPAFSANGKALFAMSRTPPWIRT